MLTDALGISWRIRNEVSVPKLVWRQLSVSTFNRNEQTPWWLSSRRCSWIGNLPPAFFPRRASSAARRRVRSSGAARSTNRSTDRRRPRLPPPPPPAPCPPPSAPRSGGTARATTCPSSRWTSCRETPARGTWRTCTCSSPRCQVRAHGELLFIHSSFIQPFNRQRGVPHANFCIIFLHYFSVRVMSLLHDLVAEKCHFWMWLI